MSFYAAGPSVPHQGEIARMGKPAAPNTNKGHRMSEPRDCEIRFPVTRRLAALVDALVQSKGLQGRADLLEPIVRALVEKELHEATILLRMAGINPADPEAGRAAAVIHRAGDAN